MTTSSTRTLIARAGLAAVILGGLAVGVAPAPSAVAGGPGQVYVYGATKSQCTDNLNAEILKYRHYGYTVTGVHGCRLAGDQTRYFGDFVAN